MFVINTIIEMDKKRGALLHSHLRQGTSVLPPIPF
jgi:hypothetical protein